jgi:hypothetical protein
MLPDLGGGLGHSLRLDQQRPQACVSDNGISDDHISDDYISDESDQ